MFTAIAEDGDAPLRINGGRIEKRAVMLTAVQTVTNTDTIGRTPGCEPHRAAQAATRDLIHLRHYRQ